MDFWHGFWVVTLVHLAAAATPGPDFVMVTQQTLTRGKRAGLWCALGIALGLAVHIVYSALGLAAVVAHSAQLLGAVKLLGGLYLIYLGVKGLRTKPYPATFETMDTRRGSLSGGFLCNVLNPKAPLYFVALFTVVIKPDIPLLYIVFYGVWMMVLQFLWFAAVAFFLSVPRIQRTFQHMGHWLDRILGGVLIGLGIRVLGSR